MILTSLASAIGRTDSYDYGTTSSDTSAAGALAALSLFYLIFFVISWAIGGIAWAGAFKKAGYEPWKAFVPFYNTWIMVKMTGRPESHFWFTFIPYFNIYMLIVIYNDVAKSFGKDSGFTVGLVLLPVIFASILSYGGAQYRGPAYVSPQQKAFAQQQYAQQQYSQQQYSQQQYQQPGYGQQQYGQPPQAPQYGQQPPQYGQAPQVPEYGQNPPAQPGYGQPQNPNPPQNPYNSGPTQ